MNSRREAQQKLLALGRETDARVADAMAEHGGTVREVAALLGMSFATARVAWRRIKAEVGE